MTPEQFRQRLRERQLAAEEPPGEAAVDRAFVVSCDPGYLPGLHALLNSIHAYHGSTIPVFVCEQRLNGAQLRRLLRHPLEVQIFRVAELPYPPAGSWEVKHQLFAHCLGLARQVCLIDADIVLTSPLDDVFELAAAGRIVGGWDSGPLRFGLEYKVYRDDLPGREVPYLNSGLVCMDIIRHWDVAGLWAFTTNFGVYTPTGGFPLRLPGHGDQGLLNAIIAMQGKTDDLHLFPRGLWHEIFCDAEMRIIDRPDARRLTVWNQSLNAQQRILHNTGPKWWRDDGAERLARFGDKLECFWHFADLTYD